MNMTYLCLLITGLLPLVCATIAKAGGKSYDNHNPRAWLARQGGFRARANAAQSNSLEALPFFAVGVWAATQAGASPLTVEYLAVAFVLARLAYIACYLQDSAALRSTFWTVGHGCAIALYVLALRA